MEIPIWTLNMFIVSGVQSFYNLFTLFCGEAEDAHSDFNSGSNLSELWHRSEKKAKI